jgi:hypothetical protein
MLRLTRLLVEVLRRAQCQLPASTGLLLLTTVHGSLLLCHLTYNKQFPVMKQNYNFPTSSRPSPHTSSTNFLTMCHLVRTRYTCAHLSPFHPLGYERPFPETNKTQSDRITEWPTHPDTSIQSCEDATRKGHRCEGRLEELEIAEKSVDRACVWCLHEHPEVAEVVSGLKEWTKVHGWSDGGANQEEAQDGAS